MNLCEQNLFYFLNKIQLLGFCWCSVWRWLLVHLFFHFLFLSAQGTTFMFFTFVTQHFRLIYVLTCERSQVLLSDLQHGLCRQNDGKTKWQRPLKKIWYRPYGMKTPILHICVFVCMRERKREGEPSGSSLPFITLSVLMLLCATEQPWDPISQACNLIN